MKYAFQNGQKIHVTDYNPDNGPLSCADEACHAKLYYTPQTTDQNGHVISPNFLSKKRADHSTECTELARELDIFKPSLPLKQAVIAGHVIILSLNDHFGLPATLSKDFGPAVHAQHHDTPLNRLKQDARYNDGRKGHRSEAVKSIDDLMRTLRLIHQHGGDDAITNTFVTKHHEIASFDKFFLSNDQKQTQHFDNLYSLGNQFSMPYLLPYKPSTRTSDEFNAQQIQSTRINMRERRVNEKQIPLLMQHHLHVQNSVDNIDALKSDAFILAVSKVTPDAQKAVNAFNQNAIKPSWVRTHWYISGDHQITPKTNPKLPAFMQGRQLQLI